MKSVKINLLKIIDRVASCLSLSPGRFFRYYSFLKGREKQTRLLNEIDNINRLSFFSFSKRVRRQHKSYMKSRKRLFASRKTKLQSSIKIMWLAPPAYLFNVGYKFAWSFLATTAWYSFSRLDATLNQGGRRNSGYVWAGLTLFWEFFMKIVSLNNFLADCFKIGEFGSRE